MDNAVFDAVRTMVAVREYKEEPIPDDLITRIIEAAHLSASSMNRQRRHFVVVRGRSRLQELGRLVRAGPYVSGSALAVIVADDDVIAVVPFGYPRRPASRARKSRKPLGEVASAETFGNPFTTT